MTHEHFESIAALDALGVATPEESRDLRAHLESCEDCRHARDEFDAATVLLAEQLDPIEPPNEVRERVLGSLGGAEVIEISGRRRFPWWIATAATLFLALWGWREMGIRVARERFDSQERDIAQLRDEVSQLQQQKQKLASAMAALGSAGTRTISLSGQQVAPTASARVFLDANARRAVVFFSNLPANPQDKSYQLWIIRADQPKPMSIGVFDADANGSATITVENLPLDTEIKALAVTLEPRGGVEQPTNTDFVVMGKT
jgi:anti-sigma-K factor RskA